MIMSLFLYGCGQEKSVQIYQDGANPASTEFYNDAKIVSEEAVTEPDIIVVYVCGAVVMPGLYELEAGARAGHAIELAGGMIEGAAIDGINLAKIVTDGEQIRVPFEGEAVAMDMSDAGSDSGGKVNLNTATAEELMTLPGIGQSKAESILKFREEHGAFSSEDEIMEIEGIKEGVYNKIKDYICVK